MESKDYQQAEPLYRSIVTNWPGTDEAFTAQKSLAIIYIATVKYAAAQTEVDALIAGFANHPQLPAALYEVANQSWFKTRYDLARQVYKSITDKCPQSDLAIVGQSWVAGCDFMTGNDESAWKEINTLATQFAGYPSLDQKIYDVAGSCWNHKKYDQAQKLYRYIVENLPDSKLNFGSRVWIVGIGIPLGDYSSAEQGINALVKEFPDHPELVGILYQVANEYWYVKRYADAKRFYEQVLARDPNHMRARLWDAGAELMLGNWAAAEAGIEKVISDFADHPDLPEQLCQMPEQYYSTVFEMKKQGRDAEAKQWFEKAIGIWERIASKFPKVDRNGDIYWYLACCYDHIGEFVKAIEHYQRLLDEYPHHRAACDAQFSIGNLYERLSHSGFLSESEANPLIEQAYRVVVENYPDCNNFKYAALRLAELSSGRQQWTQAAIYYEQFLTKFPSHNRPSSILRSLAEAYDKAGQVDRAVKTYLEFLQTALPTDYRTKEVRARIEQLQGGAVQSKRILSDSELASVYGGCPPRLCMPTWLDIGNCTVGDNGGVCNDLVWLKCTWVSGCDCMVTGKFCYLSELGSTNCVDTEVACPPSSRCYSDYCYVCGNTCCYSTRERDCGFDTMPHCYYQ
jgi:tetratricopeptide (TPR) repeat protein